MVPGSSLETRDLRLVLAIAEAGGVTPAARLLHLSQSAVSHQLRGLEERLGLAVCQRAGRNVRFTEAGERLVKLARDVLQPIAQAELELRRGVLKRRVKLRVATQCYTAYHWLPAALASLTALHPEVELALASDAPEDVSTALAEDSLDLALCVVPPSGTRLERVKLFEDELVLAVPRGHALARKKFVEGRDLVRETLILNEVAKSERDRVQKVLFRQGEGFARVLRLPITEAIVELVQAGLGVSIVASFTLQKALERGEVEAVRLTRRGLMRTWAGVYRKSSSLAGPIQTLLETLKRQPPSKRGLTA